MKKPIYLLCVIFALVFWACMQDMLEYAAPPSDGLNRLTVSEARSYFEEHAECLRPLSFSPEGTTKSGASEIYLSPRWEDAVVRNLDSSSMVELPLSSNVYLQVRRRVVDGDAKVSDVPSGFRKLVVRHRRSGAMQQFVITVVPTGKRASWYMAHPEEFNYFGGGGFNGYVFCSTLEGEFMDVYEYIDGVRYGRVLFRTSGVPTRSGTGEEVTVPEEYVAFSFMDYSTDVSGDFPEVPNPNGDCTDLDKCPHGVLLTDDCPICHDEAVVIRCPVCGMESCVCGGWGGGIIIGGGGGGDGEEEEKPEEPCPYCHRTSCDGECRTPTTGGGGGGTIPPDDTEDQQPPVITMDNFVETVLTPDFRQKVREELGVNADDVPIEIPSSLDHTAGANAAYFDVDGKIHIFEEMFTRGYTPDDMEAIMYHEFVHAKQHRVDGLVLPRDADNKIIKQEYVLPVSQEDLDSAWEDVYISLEINNIPKNAKERTPEQEQLYQYYKEFYVTPVEKQIQNGETKIEKFNKDQIKSEIEAYEKQLEQYGDRMSDKALKNTLDGLNRNSYIWSKIKDK